MGGDYGSTFIKRLKSVYVEPVKVKLDDGGVIE